MAPKKKKKAKKTTKKIVKKSTKKAAKKATKKKATKPVKKAAKKATKKVAKVAKKASSAKAKIKKSLEPSPSLKKALPVQPVDYRLVIAESPGDLVRQVKELLFVQHDGSYWVPLGSAFEEDDQWIQTMVLFS